ncbi:hypothetical protein [Legionella sp. km535]|nr:hypothetical protein [Legionella sp. km535]
MKHRKHKKFKSRMMLFTTTFIMLRGTSHRNPTGITSHHQTN